MTKSITNSSVNADQLIGHPGWQPWSGVTLRSTLRGHNSWIGRVCWSPDGKLLASSSDDKTIFVWDVTNGNVILKLEGRADPVSNVSWSPDGRKLACVSNDNSVEIWDIETSHLQSSFVWYGQEVLALAWSPDGNRIASSHGHWVRIWDMETGQSTLTLAWHPGEVNCVSWSPEGTHLASTCFDHNIRVWDVKTGNLLALASGHSGTVYDVRWSPIIGTLKLASASDDKTIRIWDANTGQATNVLEGHTDYVQSVAFDSNARLLASKSGGKDNTVRLWRCDSWKQVAVIPEPASFYWPPCIAFHPFEKLLATVGSDPDARPNHGEANECDKIIHVWQLDYGALCGNDQNKDKLSPGVLRLHPSTFYDSVLYTTAKIVLVGESGVGKTGLGWRLTHGEFAEHSSTHGQQFWVLDEFGDPRDDGTRCEAVLWDLAGQPDYRLIHALFLDDADLALVLFDPTDQRDPLGNVEYWLKQLPTDCPKILVAARVDRGHPVLTNEELDVFCQRHGIAGGWIETSAASGLGLEELIIRMKARIPWDRKTAVTTTPTFKLIKNVVLDLKQHRAGQKIVFALAELRAMLEQEQSHKVTEIETSALTPQITNAEIVTAVERLALHGFVRILMLSNGQKRILLVPELLNNLASSFVLKARQNPRGLGALEESRLIDNSYRFPELEGLGREDYELLLDATITAFLENRLSYRCFRELMGDARLLVFPELMNLIKPQREDITEEGVSYAIAGATENTFAGLVVLLGYTNAFLRTDQSKDIAYYEYERNLICGVRQVTERSGERTFVLLFSPNVSAKVRIVFEGLVERILSQKQLIVRRLRPLRCGRCQTIVDRSVMVRRMKQGKSNVGCEECGHQITLPPDEPLSMQSNEREKVSREVDVAEMRTHFEEVVFKLSRLVELEIRKKPTCFVSYAWGNTEDERWVEHRLAIDLEKAGITVILDRWDNAHSGSSIPRFLDRIAKSDRVLIVGTPAYLRKYENKDPTTGTIVAAEMDLVAARLLGTEAQKTTVIPLVLDGSPDASLPPILRARVYCDFRDERQYFSTALDLFLTLYQIEPRHPAVREWKHLLGEYTLDKQMAGREIEEESLPTDGKALARALEQVGSRSRAAAFGIGEPVVIHKHGQIVWIFPDGTERVDREIRPTRNGGVGEVQ